MKLSFTTRRRIVRIFYTWQRRYDKALAYVFEGLLRYEPKKHGFFWAVATFNINPCFVCYGWRMWGWGFAAGSFITLMVLIMRG